MRLSGHRMADVRSLALHREIARRLRAQPSLLNGVRERVRAWGADASVSHHYVSAWSQLLDGPSEALFATLERDDETATALRQASPFLGILDARQRWQIWRRAGGDGSP
jgi:hypothetical protein